MDLCYYFAGQRRRERMRAGLVNWRAFCQDGSWAERKAKRKYCYERFEFKNKLRECGACSGSGHYDHNGSPKCGSCEGTGKVRER